MNFNTQLYSMAFRPKISYPKILLGMILGLLVGCVGVDDYSESQPAGNLDKTAPIAQSIVINKGNSETTSIYSMVSLSAQDNVGISAYLISEDPTAVQNVSAVWQTLDGQKDLLTDVSIKLSYTAGTKTVYAWFKDSEDNISVSVWDSIQLIPTFDDSESPQNLTFIIDSDNASTSSRIVSVALTASDDQGVVAFYLSENPTSPQSENPGWISSAPAMSYSDSGYFPLSSGDGPKNVYSWVKDAAGNVSSSVSDTIQLLTQSTDITAPFNTSILINNNDSVTTSPSVTVDVSADDDEGVTAFYLSETDSTPDSGTAGWISVISSVNYAGAQNFGVSNGIGIKNVYGWFKDAAGNISGAVSDSIQLASFDDFSAPANPSMMINSNNPTTSSRIVTIDLSADDNQGVAAYYISETASPPLSTWPGGFQSSQPQVFQGQS